MGKGDVYGVLLSKLKQVTQQYDRSHKNCVCVCMCVSTHIHSHTCAENLAHVYIHIYTYAEILHINTYLCVYMHVFVYTHSV